MMKDTMRVLTKNFPNSRYLAEVESVAANR
jgi:hypothetical protein